MLPESAGSYIKNEDDIDRKLEFFSAIDKQILKRCHKEASVYRAFPFAVIGAGIVTLAFKRNCTINRVRHTPWIFLAAVAGWTFGILTKQTECTRRVAHSESKSEYANIVRSVHNVPGPEV
ncbi:hypothetical protein HDE_08117 [Halotydeus destructor]|nr:hypothetical protein HDE_08117 [Halotydeus destructor]